MSGEIPSCAEWFEAARMLPDLRGSRPHIHKRGGGT